MSCRSESLRTSHQNTPESIERGNVLLARSDEMLKFGNMLDRQIRELEEARHVAFESARGLRSEAEKVLMGGRYRG